MVKAANSCALSSLPQCPGPSQAIGSQILGQSIITAAQRHRVVSPLPLIKAPAEAGRSSKLCWTVDGLTGLLLVLSIRATRDSCGRTAGFSLFAPHSDGMSDAKGTRRSGEVGKRFAGLGRRQRSNLLGLKGAKGFIFPNIHDQRTEAVLLPYTRPPSPPSGGTPHLSPRRRGLGWVGSRPQVHVLRLEGVRSSPLVWERRTTCWVNMRVPDPKVLDLQRPPPHSMRGGTSLRMCQPAARLQRARRGPTPSHRRPQTRHTHGAPPRAQDPTPQRQHGAHHTRNNQGHTYTQHRRDASLMHSREPSPSRPHREGKATQT